jgi:hypothetical protein
LPSLNGASLASGALGTVLAGTLIDGDLLPDFLLNARRKEPRLTFVLHSWELWTVVAVAV